ncbi:MAG: tRNA pseudouridine synthase A [Phycisphaeraceae bacterium]|nr:MAG: tRNA pseudouridine synthase A [Phycisphaeraceae bacterium]
MPRYKLTIAYDGTDFCGWQKQEPPASEHPGLPTIGARPGEDRDRVALRTVQHALEQAVREVVREPVVVTGASRTDSGVHANGQVAAFTSIPDTDKGVGWPADRGTHTLIRALNGRLPRDVLVRAIEVVDDVFEPIAGAVEKEYTYTVVSGLKRPLWDRRYVFHTWYELDVERMRAAAALLVGEHDFASFAQVSHGRKTTVRTITGCEIEVPTLSPPGRGQGEGSSTETPLPAQDPSPQPSPQRGEEDEQRFIIRVRGSGFLYNMVRILAGTLMEAGRGTLDPNRIPEILESKDRTANPGPTLPPQGLRLEWIRYG